MEYGTSQNVCNVFCCYKLQSLVWHCELQQLVSHTPKSFRQVIHEPSIQSLWFNHRYTLRGSHTRKSGTKSRICLCFFWFPLLITTHHCSTHMSPPPEVCNRPGQIAHYHVLNLSAGGFISLRQHLAAYRIRIYALFTNLTKHFIKNDL